MKNELDKLGNSLGKDAKESRINTRRIAPNLPQIERKLDIVSSGYNFKMDLPVIDESTVASLNIYIRPDNCCECDAGTAEGTRRVTGQVTEFKDIDGNPFVFNQPADSPYNGIDYKGIVTSMETVGTLSSSWFAWPGYPFFYPNGVYESDYELNAFGDFELLDETITLPTKGVYNILYTGHVSGATTATSKITITLRNLTADIGQLIPPTWQTMSKEVMSVQKGNLEPDSFMIATDIKISAICYGFMGADEIAVWIQAEDINNFNPGTGTLQMTLMGLGYGQITGYVYHDAPNLNPIEGATVQILLPTMGSVTTNVDGRYTITNVPPGIHTIQATYSTFSATQQVSVERNKVTTDVNFIL